MRSIGTIIVGIGFVIAVVGIDGILKKAIFILLDRMLKCTDEKEVK